jgi:hypothetical protein
MTGIAVGDYVEVPVSVNGEQRMAVGVIRSIANPSSNDALAHIDFGAGVKGEKGDGSVLVWRSVKDLKRVAGNVKASPTTDREPAGIAKQQAHTATATSTGKAAGIEEEKQMKATSNQPSGSMPSAKGSPKQAGLTATEKGPRESTSVASAAAIGEAVPTLADQAVYTLIAGPLALMSAKRPLVTIFFLVVFTTVRSIQAGVYKLPDGDPLGLDLCEVAVNARTAAPPVLHDLLVRGRLPAHETFRSLITDPRGTLRRLHDAIEASQRAPATKPAAALSASSSIEIQPKGDVAVPAATDASESSVVPARGTPLPQMKESSAALSDNKKKKKLKDKQPSDGDNGTTSVPTVPVKTPVAPLTAPNENRTMAADPPHVNLTATDLAFCAATADMLLTVCWLVIIGSTTAYQFANPRELSLEFAKKFKLAGYIGSVVIVTYAAVSSGMFSWRESLEAAESESLLAGVIMGAVRSHSLVSITLEQVAVNATLHLVGGLIGYVLSLVVALCKFVVRPTAVTADRAE